MSPDDASPWKAVSGCIVYLRRERDYSLGSGRSDNKQTAGMPRSYNDQDFNRVPSVPLSKDLLKELMRGSVVVIGNLIDWEH